MRCSRSGALSAYRKMIADGCSDLYVYAAVIKGSRQDAVELVRQTYLTAWKKKDEIRDPEKIDIWMKGIMCRIALPRGKKETGNPDFRKNPAIDKLMRKSLENAKMQWILNETEQQKLCSEVIREIKRTMNRKMM